MLQVINAMFASAPAEELWGWSDPSPLFNMALFSLLKFLLTALCIGLPLPVGLFTPLFTCGAVFGR